MTKLEYRSSQTQVKHEILARYLDAWGGIITNGLCHFNHPFTLKFVYVDCFAYKGKYLGDKESIFQYGKNPGLVYGSPIIGIKALDKLALYAKSLGCSVVTNSILIEKERDNFNDLKDTLAECNYLNRLKETDDFFSLQNGEIAILNADAIQLKDKLTNFTNIKGTWSFYLVDPYGAKGIPFEFVQQIVRGDRHDVMINLIYEDLLRKTGMVFNENINPQLKTLVENWKKAYGIKNWNQKVLQGIMEINGDRNLRSALGDENLSDEEIDLYSEATLIRKREEILVESYKQTLTDMDPNVAKKLISLQFPDKARTMFYLFLTTHDPTGALVLNQILNDAKLLEYELKYRYKTLKSIPCGQLSLWSPIEAIPEQVANERFPIEDIACEILQCQKGNSLTKKDLYMCLIDKLYFTSEIDKALKLLVKQGNVSYTGKLNHKTTLHFN